MKRNPNRLTHPVGAFTPKSVMRSSIVTKGRKIPIAAKIRAAARRARAASQSSSDSSGSSGPSPEDQRKYRLKMKRNQSMQFDMDPPAAAPAAPAAATPSFYPPLLFSPSKSKPTYIKDGPKEKDTFGLRKLSLSPLTVNTNVRTKLTDDEKNNLKLIANNIGMKYPGAGFSPVSKNPVQNLHRKYPNYSKYYPFENKTEMTNYEFNRQTYMNVLKFKKQVKASAAAAPEKKGLRNLRSVTPTEEEVKEWYGSDDDDNEVFTLHIGGRRKTKRKPIKINPKMKGVFTRKAKKHKMSVQKYAKYIIKKYKGKTKNKRQLKLLKQAVFAKTAKKWKKRKRKFSRKKRRK